MHTQADAHTAQEAHPLQEAGHPVTLIATDLDGTFLDPRGELIDTNVDALRHAHSLGSTIVIATGRPYRWTEVIKPLISLNPLLVSSNGGMVISPSSGEVLHSWPIDTASGRAFGAALHNAVPDIGFAVEFVSHEWGADLAYTDSHPGTPDVVASLNELLNHGPVVKLLAQSLSLSTEPLAAAAAIPAQGLVEMTFSVVRDHGLIECSAPGVSKASALSTIMAEQGIDPASAMAFGDMPNDLPMLRLVGHPFAMTDAHRLVLTEGFPLAGLSYTGAVGNTIMRVLGDTGS